MTRLNDNNNQRKTTSEWGNCSEPCSSTAKHKNTVDTFCYRSNWTVAQRRTEPLKTRRCSPCISAQNIRQRLLTWNQRDNHHDTGHFLKCIMEYLAFLMNNPSTVCLCCMVTYVVSLPLGGCIQQQTKWGDGQTEWRRWRVREVVKLCGTRRSHRRRVQSTQNDVHSSHSTECKCVETKKTPQWAPHGVSTMLMSCELSCLGVWSLQILQTVLFFCLVYKPPEQQQQQAGNKVKQISIPAAWSFHTGLYFKNMSNQSRKSLHPDQKSPILIQMN